MHKYAHGAKGMQLKLSQKFFNYDDVKGGFYKDREIGGVICGMKMLKQKMREKIVWVNRSPGGSAESSEKF